MPVEKQENGERKKGKNLDNYIGVDRFPGEGGKVIRVGHEIFFIRRLGHETKSHSFQGVRNISCQVGLVVIM